MLRLFDEHLLRTVRSLDGLWALQRADGQQEYPVLVPGVWERIPDWADYRGKAVYQRQMMVEADGAQLIRFGGVSHTARVEWDGQEIASHYNAFTGFDALIPWADAGVHQLTVHVDNSYGEASTLHVPNDYMTYGGITRPVEIHRLPDCFIRGMAFHAVEREAGCYTAYIRVTVEALKDMRGLSLTVLLADAMRDAELNDLRAGERQEVEIALEVNGVQPWDVLSASLYMLRAVLARDGVPMDDLIDRVGFRTVEVSGQQILLNHQPVKLRGFNRHEDHGLFGCALGVDAMMQDLQLILDMGGNSVRTSHYPNDPRFLDLCDELGILVWEEHHARAIKAPVLFSDTFARQIAQCNEEMIGQHVNHPCIYVWGVLNECESETPEGRELYAWNLAQLRELDPTRPVTFASCRHFTDICLDLVDIVSWNIYPGWYLQESPADFLARLLQWPDDHGGAEKPVIISEIGAGAIPGYHDPFRRAKWSEERQADILTDQLRAVLDNERITGVYVWQFADVPVDESWAFSRPRTMNNKGVVDEFRRPKLGYQAVKAVFTAEEEQT